MSDILAGLLLLLGGVFCLVAAIGVLRLPDVLTRMHASTKAGTLGSALILAAAAIDFASTDITGRVIVTIGFLLLTAPIGAHMIGRAYARVEGKLPEEATGEAGDETGEERQG